jgi:hypothetical protein
MLAFTFTAFIGSPLDSKVGALEVATLDLVASLQALCGRLVTSQLVMSSRAVIPRFLCRVGSEKNRFLALKRVEQLVESGRERSSVRVEIRTLNESVHSSREFNMLTIEIACAKLSSNAYVTRLGLRHQYVYLYNRRTPRSRFWVPYSRFLF